MTEQPEQLMFHGREIAMTATEKAAMRHKLLAYTLSNPSRIAAASVAWSWVRRHAVMSTVLAAVLVVGATGVSASMSGPNDALYDFRLKVNDRIESAIALDEDSQLDVELRQIERQLDAEEGAADEALADDEQDEVEGSEGIETPRPEKLNLNGSKKSEDDESDDEDGLSEDEPRRNNAPLNIDDGLESELRQVERELQQEESVNIELEN